MTASRAAAKLEKLQCPKDEDANYDNTTWCNRDLIPTPPERRTFGVWSYLGYWTVTGSNISAWMVGSSLLNFGLSPQQAIGAVILGGLVTGLLAVSCGWMGELHHIGFTVCSRFSWGMRGSYFPVTLRVFCGCIWFGLQAFWGGQAMRVAIGALIPGLAYLPNQFDPNSHLQTNDFIGLVLWMCLYIPGIMIRPEKLQIGFFVCFVCFCCSCLGLLIWTVSRVGGPGSMFHEPGTSPNVGWAFMFGLMSVLGAWGGGTLGQSDWTRYSSRRYAPVLSQLVASPITISVTAIFGIIVTSAARDLLGGELQWNPIYLLASIQENYQSSPASRAGVFFASAGFVCSQLSISLVLDAMSCGMDLAGLWPKYINIRRGAYIMTVVGIATQPWQLLATATKFIMVMIGFGVFIAPAVGVLLADYHIIRRRKLNLQDLYIGDSSSVYWFDHGFNWRAFVAFFAGVWPLLLFASSVVTARLQSPPSVCRCVPDDDCWPPDEAWDVFNSSLGGNLIKSRPVAISCYVGPEQDARQCSHVNAMWSDKAFQTEQPLGRYYSYNMTCPPVDFAARLRESGCDLGQLPVYAVNVTARHHASRTLAFAQQHNIRLTIVNTGHELNGRVDGFGSLAIWIRHLRNEIRFHSQFQSATGCTASDWSGSAIHIDGAWQWGDVHRVARRHNVIVVSGGSESPGATGGWLSGGGHGPATRNYGLGADQLLEAEVMLANGSVVFANHCQHTDLFRALRGGGPGYGIVLGTMVKAYPNVGAVTAHRLNVSSIRPTVDNAELLDVVSILMQTHPDLIDAGFAGYATWFRNMTMAVVGNSSSGYTHSIWTIGEGKEAATAALIPLRKELSMFGDKLLIEENLIQYDDYWSFYEAELGRDGPPGDSLLITSRLLNRNSLVDGEAVREAVEVVSGKAGENTFNIVGLVSGGKVFEDATDTTSGLNPAWRSSHMMLLTVRPVSRNATYAQRQAVIEDVTTVKGAATKKLSPDTGAYMNEGDRNDPDYIRNFYGRAYDGHLAAKKRYDPDGIFYCPTCVGAAAFIDRPDGPLCMV
ncbi:hypothetical protein CP533_5266 [Ophiocordyceps camponoti-saundersi (nom. inval.)]|nr:hypothetical protein CP533_5266 [Ophiocordyceps camponoti-saundersi (nom. inval.)]